MRPRFPGVASPPSAKRVCKRAAFFGTDVFLRMNGWWLQVQAKRAHAFLVGLLEIGTCDHTHLLAWIKRSVRRT